MSIKIALAGNPNCGKTTLFNALTGSNQFVGNWPGVTVEKKEGKLKKHDDIIITDLPGIYSLSPYTLEEVVARNYLINERPDAILNLIDGTNLERNLYLTTQLVELGIPVVIAINMMDVVKKNGDKINTSELSRHLGCKVVEISALKGTGIMEAAEVAIEAAKNGKTIPQHKFCGEVEHALGHIEEHACREFPEEQQRWYAVKLFERDSKVMENISLAEDVVKDVEAHIAEVESTMDDDSESIITNERYIYIAEIIKSCYKKKNKGSMSTSDKIDKIVTNRWLGLPIFAVIMFLVYYISMVSVGQLANDWVNDGVFGDGWHLFGIGSSAYNDASDAYTDSLNALAAYGVEIDPENYDYNEVLSQAKAVLDSDEPASVTYAIEDEENLDMVDYTVYLDAVPDDLTEDQAETTIGVSFADAVSYLEDQGEDLAEPDPADYGVFVPSIPDAISSGLEKINAADWVSGLVVDGIVAGLGAVLGFTPQILVLFFLLAILESCGYMARIAFVLDRVFRKFGLSGKSFIPMLVGTGCGVPGIMASRTIESDKDRRMTVMTTTFIPCGAKAPFIALIAGAVFGGSAWVATSAYFIGIAAIIVSGIMLKKTKMFAGDPAPFVMELPAYHLPTIGNLLRSTWERGWAFIKKEFTLILLSTIVIWFTTYFGFVDGAFRMLSEEEISHSILAAIGNGVAWIFAPLGWGTWQGAVASVTGLVAKENIVATMGIFYGSQAAIGEAFNSLSGMSFLVFNLLCAPCFAAMGAIAGEMKSAKWTAFAIAYQCGFAYIIALCIYQFGAAFTGNMNIIGLIAAIIIVIGIIFMLVRPQKDYSKKLKKANS